MAKLRWWPLAAIGIWSSAANAKVWTQTSNAPPEAFTRDQGLAAGVDDGHALIVQPAIDVASGANALAWQFDPVAQIWGLIAILPARSCEALVGLADGTFLCAYGESTAGARSTTGWIWSPATAAWTATAATTTDRARPQATRLADGRALFCGGDAPGASGAKLTSCELYDPVARTWKATAPMPGSRCNSPGFVGLADGRAAMIATDATCAVPTSTLFYDPKTDAWTSAAGPGSSPMSVAATRAGVAFLGPAGTLFGLDPSTGATTPIDAPTSFRPDRLVAIGDRWLLVLGSPFSTTPQPEQAVLLDPVTKTYRAIPAPPSTPWPSMVVSAGDTALLAGGYQPGATGASVPFTATDVLTIARDGAACSDPDACSSFGCLAGKCGATCGVDADCAAGHACDGGACVASLPLGAACARDGLCGSGHCLDGHCCGDAKGCAPYTCVAAGGCAKTCTASAQCATGNVCVGGACVPDPTLAACSDDLTQSVPKVGQPVACAPLLCDPSKGSCRPSCAQSDQCAGGFQCDPATSHCIPSSGAASDSGGCAIGDGDPRDTRERAIGASACALALVGLGLARGRRRRRSA